ncbi:hypothetical protein CALVIDRAFT_564514 [Calocera viscosa TUFC12733]|uniref:Uncharacterized protein n=1 Tax=Calocera viscosa (strain TUFC12733) TaxID=1330018 RepID=A0A167LN33_CALVF|nr:hypothetical protein CALVIDRAFT_564514 [Calocera viscosa TUFC12733]
MASLSYFRSRNDRGIYDMMIAALDADPAHSLGDAESMKGVVLWKHQNSETIDWCEYGDGGHLVPKQFVIGGEVGPGEEGTVWGAHGRLRAQDVVYDRTSVKNRVALHMPTQAPQELQDIFSDQEYNLGQQLIAAEGGQKKAEQVLEQTSAGRGGGTLTTWGEPYSHVIYLNTEPIYTRVTADESRDDRHGPSLLAYASLGPSNRKRRAGQQDGIEGRVLGESEPSEAAFSEPSSQGTDEVDLYQPMGEGLSATYSLKVLPDHDGPLFQQRQARVKQLPFYRADGELVKPWEHAEVFRPGTLVLAVVTLVDKAWLRDVLQIYQLQLVSMRELDPSPFPIETRPANAGASGGSRTAQSSPMKVARGAEIDLSALLAKASTGPSRPEAVEQEISEGPEPGSPTDVAAARAKKKGKTW